MDTIAVTTCMQVRGHGPGGEGRSRGVQVSEGTASDRGWLALGHLAAIHRAAGVQAGERNYLWDACSAGGAGELAQSVIFAYTLLQSFMACPRLATLRSWPRPTPELEVEL